MTAPPPRPAASPCGSCPYRRDVPSGVWSEDEYAKLPPYDRETPYQPPEVFFCHQQDGRLCAGWVGTHDMAESLGVRMAIALDLLTREDADALCDYVSPVPLFESGQAAADHGLADLLRPGEKAVRTIQRLARKQARAAEDERLRAIAAAPVEVLSRGVPPRCDECGGLARWWYEALNRYLCDPCAKRAE